MVLLAAACSAAASSHSATRAGLPTASVTAGSPGSRPPAPPALPRPPSTPAPAAPPPPVTLNGGGLPVPALPSDLRGSSAATEPGAPDHDVDDDHAAAVGLTAGDVAAAWTIARTASRFDTPAADRLDQLSTLAADATTATLADQAAPRADPAANEVHWAIVTAVENLGDGWWRVRYRIKQTRHGQAGPATTQATLDVHVTADLLVDAERS